MTAPEAQSCSELTFSHNCQFPRGHRPICPTSFYLFEVHAISYTLLFTSSSLSVNHSLLPALATWQICPNLPWQLGSHLLSPHVSSGRNPKLLQYLLTMHLSLLGSPTFVSNSYPATTMPHPGPHSFSTQLLSSHLYQSLIPPNHAQSPILHS